MAHLILYDGVCGLCNRLVRIVLKYDRAGCFNFLSLQSPKSADLLDKYGRNPVNLDTVYVIVDYSLPSENLRERHGAIIFICSKLGGIWGMLSWSRVLPNWLVRPLYDFIARSRYSVFGRLGSCPLPDPSVRDRFLD
ncbi:MAG: DCC1-like thiol-disulfide oxidoreductase family protein [Candidatus Zixiibacteriota bacterium]